jgi:hypothetical protein
VTIKDAGGFNIYEGQGLSGFTAWDIGIVGAAEVSNSDGIDPTNQATNTTVASSRISTGDNVVAIKSNTGGGTGKNGPSSAISFLNNQTGAGIGLTIGSVTSANVSNVLVNGLVQYGSNNNTAQQVGHGIHTFSGDAAGTVSTVTFENTCVANEQEDSLLYNVPTGTGGIMTNINELNTTILGSSNVQIEGYSGNVATFTLTNLDAGTVTGTYQYLTAGGQAVSFSAGISGTGVTNNIVSGTPTANCTAGTTGYPAGAGNPVAPASWQPIHGDLSAQIAGQSNYTTYNTALASVAIVLQASILPTMEINTQEMTALSQPVAFYDNGTLLGTGAIGGNGTYAHYAVTATTGSHTYTARYSGDSNYPGVVYNFGSVSVQVGTSSVVPVGPIQFQGTVVVQ